MKPSLLLLIAFVCIYAISGKNVVQANSFSELWKKHGGEVLGTDSETLKSDEQKPEKKSKFSLPKIELFNIEIVGEKFSVGGYATNPEQIESILFDEDIIPHRNGKFEILGYLPPSGKEFTIRVKTKLGVDVLDTLFLERSPQLGSVADNLEDLNPLSSRRKVNDNAVALIIGVANYEKTTSKAEYADRDAQQFIDYAHLILGIPKRNILALVEQDADKGEIAFASKHKLFQLIEPGKSELFVFFAGHGLAHKDDLYLLPVDGRPEVVASTAVSRTELFSDIAKTGAVSVTVFLDSCYSGISRNGEMLVSARPVMIKEAEASFPANFHVFSAAGSNQVSRPLNEKKHGLFSYFLMKGLEGEANKDGDDKLTTAELHQYVSSMVGRFSGLEQSPQFNGDPNKVLIQY